MKTESKNKKIRCDFFRDLYERALTAYSPTLDALERNMKQYKGDSEIDGSRESALTVRNITYEIVESQVSSDIPMPKADAATFSESRGRNAQAIERLLRSLRVRLPFQEFNDLDERYTYIYGASVAYLEWDGEEEYLGELGAVRLHCLSPKELIPQPGIFDTEDMEYLFLRLTTTRGELARRYGVAEAELDSLELLSESDGTDPEGDAAIMVICFYKDEEGDVCRFIFSGDVTLSDIPKYYYRKGEVCSVCGEAAGECDCTSELISVNLTHETLPYDIISRNGKRHPKTTPVIENGHLKISHGATLFEPTRLPYYVPRSYPVVVRKNTSSEKSLLGQSDCEFIRPEQQAINKIESRILEKLLRAGITPIVPEDASISLNNSVFGQVIRLKPGESVAQYGKVDTTPDISQDVAEAERLYDHAKRIIGISDTFQGIDQSYHESGYAKQLRISQASGRLESKRRMKEAAYSEIDRRIFELYLAFADEPRRLSYKDAYGRVHSEEFNRYDFIELDTTLGEYFFDDAYLFTPDRNEGAEWQREAMWERNLENLKAGTLGDPTSPVTLLRYWQCQERAHYPHARENVEYFKSEVESGGVVV